MDEFESLKGGIEESELEAIGAALSSFELESAREHINSLIKKLNGAQSE